MSLPENMLRWPTFAAAAKAFGVDSMRKLASSEGVDLPTSLQRLLIAYVNLAQPAPPKFEPPFGLPTQQVAFLPGTDLSWSDPAAGTPHQATRFQVQLAGHPAFPVYKTTIVDAGLAGTTVFNPVPGLPENHTFILTIDALNAASECLEGSLGHARTVVSFMMQSSGGTVVDPHDGGTDDD